MDGWFEVDDSTVDHTEAEFQRWQKDNPHPEPGVIPRIINTRATDVAPRPRPTATPDGDTLGSDPATSRLTEHGLDG